MSINTNGIAVYSSIATTINLLNVLRQLFEGFTFHNERLKSLTLRVKDDLNLSEGFLSLIAQMPSGTLQDADEAVLYDLSNYLQPLIAKCQTKLRSLEAQGSQKTDDARVHKSVFSEVEGLEENIAEWNRRLHMRTSLLSHKVQFEVLQKSSDQSPDMQWLREVSQLQRSIDAAQKHGQRLNPKDLELKDIAQVRFEASSGRSFGTFQGQRVIVERMCETVGPESEDAVGILASKLSLSVPSSFHLLQRVAYFPDPPRPGAPASYRAVFQLPGDSERIDTLSSLLGGHEPLRLRPEHEPMLGSSNDQIRSRHSLSQRFRLARNITTSLLYMHSFGWQHKAVRSHNVLVIQATTHTAGDIGHSVLAGFEEARADEGSSDQRAFDLDWRNNIYRPPWRAAESLVQILTRHTRRDDVFSLGVVLLELGLWKSLIRMRTKFKDRSSTEIQNTLTDLVSRELPRVMGDRYSDVVKYCLLLPAAEEISNQSFVEKVLIPLESLASVV